jgi:hypothetical protein
MDSSYVTKVQEWVTLDNQLIRNKQDIQSIVSRKKELEDDILDYVETNGLESMTLSITDGNIKFSKRTNTQPLTIKTLRSLLTNMCQDENDEQSDESIVKRKRMLELLSPMGLEEAIDVIMDYVTSNLTKKSIICLKRDIRDMNQE